MHSSRVLAGFFLAVVIGLSIANAAAAPLPAGWRFEGEELVWTSPAPLRMGGARYEFRSGSRLLGYPRQDADTLRLRLPSRDSLDDLSVRAAGRRIDQPLAQARIAAAPPPPEAAIAEAAVDPALPGPYRTERLAYRLRPLTIPEFPVPVEVLAEVTAPVDDLGPMPVVLFLHGRHSTCYQGGPTGTASGDWPCPPGWRAVPSHTGYRYIADVLASRGYLAISIAANGVNGQDGLFIDGGSSARSRLVRHHLARWAKWSARGGDPWGGKFRGRVDLDRLVLVGHSRGGEGVERAAIDSDAADPWNIRGLVLIGPTAFVRQVTPGVHTAVILPFCDGDVTDLQGQQYVDAGRDLTRDRALRSSIVAMGTNHNYYNTEWTPGLSKSPAWDDWFDPADAQCGETRSRRLSPAEQQAVGLAYTAALVDLAIERDLGALPLLDGTRVKPRSIGRAVTSVHAIGGGKRVVYAPGSGRPVAARGLRASECRGYFVAGPFDIRTGCTPRLSFEMVPHWSPMAFAETAPPPRALEVAWSKAGGSVRIPVAMAGSRAESLDLRIVGNPGAPPVAVDVRVGDGSGRWVKLSRRPLRLHSYFGPSPIGKALARQLRASLRGSGLDPARITEVELIPRTSRGRFWLLDISARERGLPPDERIALPRVSVGDVTAVEGDSGTHGLEVPILVEGAVTRRARLWVQLNDSANFEQPMRGFPLVLEPGATSASIPLTYTADDIYSPFPQVTQVTLLAQRHAVTADLEGEAFVEEDDPPPVLTVDASQVTVADGSVLAWTFRLSEPLAYDAFWSVEFRPAAGMPELDSDDVTPEFLAHFGIDPPDPAVPLSQLGIFLAVELAPGDVEATVTIPTRADGVDEPAEGVALILDGFGDPVVPQPIELTGVVQF